MNILITGAGSVMGQSIYKALAEHDFGEPLQIHFANSDELGAGRFFNQPSAPVIATPIFPLAASESYIDFLEDYVARHSIDIVFAGTQHELAKIATFRDRTLKAATLSSQAASICLDKVKTSAVLGRHSVRVPQTFSLADYLLNDQCLGAVVIKPNHSSSSRNIYKVADIGAARRLIADETLNVNAFLVQEMLVGDEYTCGCYIDRYSKSTNIIVFKRTLTPDGATSFGEIVHSPAIHDYVASVASALVAEGLDFGHINVQLIMTASGPVLFEINGRLSSTEGSKARYGFNSCAAFVYNVVLGKSYEGWSVARSGRFLRYYEELYFQ